ncbi:alkaline phosphatase [Dokdonia sp. Hel_I_53]|uniref:alkaline phosphatase n=1 Tax=Dokdonia sp. Hel_I_53 TaxID=1566287 RepID=UPI00119AD777|nr:alkaline phosphatase [Dokdonia sp. Hel_I_53]TVZ53148.1 alkaline phosphatase [Dokdonia sp. Hel_I_53]
MSLRRILRCFSIAIVFVTISCASTVTTAQNKKPKNIILMIADGTGLSQISASQFYNSQPSNYERFKNIGLIKTSSSSDLITDSAAGATAFSAGIKTYNGAIGVNTDTIAVPTILEDLEKRQFSTGVIATSTITHATPGSFYAHQKFRKMELEIAEDLLTSGVDFFAGGGRKFFENREDKLNLVAALEDLGYVMQLDRLDPSKRMKKNEKYGYLLADAGMPKILEGRGSFLYDATKLGLKKLSQNKKGFFLMVEGSQVDWGGHNNDAEYLISELIDFDTVLGLVLDYAEKDGNTLVIVTADHETGGFTLAADNGNYNKLKPSFSTGGHSATMVPVFSYGPGSSLFSGIYENTAVYDKMKRLLKE